MAKFFIGDALLYAVKTYVKHFILFLSLGVVLGVASWAGVIVPRLAAQKLGVYKSIVIKYQQIMPEQPFRSNTPPRSGLSSALNVFAHSAGTSIAYKAIEHIKNASKLSLLIIFAIWLMGWFFSAFLHLGFVQVTLDVKDMHISSFDRLFSVWNFFPSYIAASFLFGLLALSAGIGFITTGTAIGVVISAVVTTFFNAQALGTIALFVSVVISLVSLLLFLLRYIFYGYCIVDKEVSALEALSCSRDITRGSLQTLTLFFVVLYTCMYGLLSLVSLGTGYSLGQGQIELTVLSLLHVILVVTVGGSLFGLALVYVYRRLAS